MGAFEDFLNFQTSYRHLLLSVLDICKDQRCFADIRDFVGGYPGADGLSFSPTEIVVMLKDFNAINITFNDMEKIEYVKTTPYGLEIAEKYDASKSLSDLFDNAKNLTGVYLQLLTLCKNGKSMTDLETILGNDEELQREKVFVHYCVRELEKAGGICWHDNAWHTTDIGGLRL